MNAAAIPDPGIEVEGGPWQAIQIFDDRSVLISDDLLSAPERNPGEAVQQRAAVAQEVEQ